MKRIIGTIRGGLAALTESRWRPLQLLVVALLVLVVGSMFLTPVHSLWSKNLVIKGDASIRAVPDRCKDIHFDSYFWGTDKDDKIHGTTGNDMIWGLKGHDEIYGHGGSDCFDGGDDQDKCDDGDGWYKAYDIHLSFDVNTGEHEAKRTSCDQWGYHFRTKSWWHHSTPTIELAWDAVDGTVYYNVYRATVSGGPYSGIASPAVAAYTDTDVQEGVTYYYVMTAVDAEGFESVPSVETSQMVPVSTPSTVPTDTPVPTLAPDATPEPTLVPDPTPAADATPAPTPDPTPAPDATPAPTPDPTPAPDATPAPVG